MPCAQAKPVSTAASLNQASFMDMTTAVGPSSFAAAAASPGGSTAARVAPEFGAVVGLSTLSAPLRPQVGLTATDWLEGS